jgi:hypothetical protein
VLQRLRCHSARISLGKGDETRTRKPFVATLRVTKSRPANLGQAAEGLRGVGRPPGRSVDSQSQGRVIEPRNLSFAGAFVVDTSGGHVEAPQWPGVLGPTGVQEQGIGTQGLPRNLGDPAVPTDNSGSGTGTSTPRSPRPCASTAGSKIRRKGGIAKRRQRSAARRAAGGLSVP